MFDRDRLVRTDDDVLLLAREVIAAEGGRGPTLWVLLLDDTDRAVPLMVPIEHVPVDPDPEDVGRLAGAVAAIVRGAAAERAVLIWERRGSGTMRMQEADWTVAMAEEDLPIRAQLVASDDGVRLLDPVFEAIVAR